MGVSFSNRSEQANIGLDLGNGETSFDKNLQQTISVTFSVMLQMTWLRN